MNAVNSKTFKSGNSVALRLPKSLAIGPDEQMLIEQTGDTLIVRRVADPAAEKARLRALLDDLEAMGAPADGVQPREPFEFPDRAGL